jgi:hypothetical protein
MFGKKIPGLENRFALRSGLTAALVLVLGFCVGYFISYLIPAFRESRWELLSSTPPQSVEELAIVYRNPGKNEFSFLGQDDKIYLVSQQEILASKSETEAMLNSVKAKNLEMLKSADSASLSGLGFTKEDNEQLLKLIADTRSKIADLEKELIKTSDAKSHHSCTEKLPVDTKFSDYEGYAHCLFFEVALAGKKSITKVFEEQQPLLSHIYDSRNLLKARAAADEAQSAQDQKLVRYLGHKMLTINLSEQGPIRIFKERFRPERVGIFVCLVFGVILTSALVVRESTEKNG